MNREGRRFPFFKGRVALHAILEAAGIGPGDQVLLPGYTCVVVPNAVLYRGAEPVFLDIDPVTCNLTPSSIRGGRDRCWDPARARAVIVQHTYGLPADVPAVAAEVRKDGLLVIEDACHALGSTWRGQLVGTLSDAAFFSTQWSKPITTGLGGWAEVTHPQLADAVSQVANGYRRAVMATSFQIWLQYAAHRVLYRPGLFWQLQTLYRKLGGLGLLTGSSAPSELAGREPAGYRRRMGHLQIRLWRRQLARSDEQILRRRRCAALIESELRRRGLPCATVPQEADPVWLRYPLRVGNKTALLARARAERIELGDWFLSPVHPNLENWQAAGYQAGSCPQAERAAREMVNIPTHPALAQRDIEKIVAFVAAHADAP
jgi:perosamine synthetase